MFTKQNASRPHRTKLLIHKLRLYYKVKYTLRYNYYIYQQKKPKRNKCCCSSAII